MAYWLRKDMRPVELAREAFVRRDSNPMITSSVAGPMAHA